MVPPVAAQGYVVYAGQGCTTLAVSASQRAAGGRRERMCGWWKCAGSMFRMFRAKARPALCGSYGSACSGGRPARLLAAHVDLLPDLGDDVAVAVDDVGLEPVQAFVAVGGGAADVVEPLVAGVELDPTCVGTGTRVAVRVDLGGRRV